MTSAYGRLQNIGDLAAVHLHGDVIHGVRSRVGADLPPCLPISILSEMTARVIMATWKKRDLSQLLRVNYQVLLDLLADIVAETVVEFIQEESLAA